MIRPQPPDWYSKYSKINLSKLQLRWDPQTPTPWLLFQNIPSSICQNSSWDGILRPQPPDWIFQVQSVRAPAEMGSSDHNLLNWYSRIFQDQSARDHWAAFHIMRGSWEEAANYWPHTTESAYDLNLWGPCVDEFCVQVQKATPFYSGTIIVQSWSLAAQKHGYPILHTWFTLE